MPHLDWNTVTQNSTGSVEKDVCYSLYRYTEKLTDCVFSESVQCENGFECFIGNDSSEREHIFIEAPDQF